MRAHLNIIQPNKEGTMMGAFILGLIIGAGGALMFLIHDEGEAFLKLSQRIKASVERYRQSS
jgi:hypothetical protein